METARILLVDPTENTELRELAELTGLPVRSCRLWPFDVGPAERVVATVPVPASASAQVLGVRLAEAQPRAGERWPERCVDMHENPTEIIAHLAGAYRANGKIVGLVGIRGGLGTSTLAAALARQLAREPYALALVDWGEPSGFAGLVPLEGQTVRWADIDGKGPYLPHRLLPRLPVWNRVRVLTADGRGRGPADIAAGLVALASASDAVVADCGRGHELSGGLVPRGWLDAVIVVLTGTRPDLEAARPWVAADTLTIAALRKGGDLLAEEVEETLGIGVVEVGHERGVAAACLRGESPGDRPRGTIGRAARELASRITPLL